jgi:hypothetical protein
LLFRFLSLPKKTRYKLLLHCGLVLITLLCHLTCKLHSSFICACHDTSEKTSYEKQTQHNLILAFNNGLFHCLQLTLKRNICFWQPCALFEYYSHVSWYTIHQTIVTLKFKAHIQPPNLKPMYSQFSMIFHFVTLWVTRASYEITGVFWSFCKARPKNYRVEKVIIIFYTFVTLVKLRPLNHAWYQTCIFFYFDRQRCAMLMESFFWCSSIFCAF